MSRRCQRDYVAVFKTLIDRVGNLAVEGFVADFELGMVITWLLLKPYYLSKPNQLNVYVQLSGMQSGS